MTPETAAKSALTEALAAVQAKLPEVRKGETAEVETKAGRKYKYSYANLAAISKSVLPLLGEHGLTWITKPTLVDGRFVLAYKLTHVSGEYEAGEYPLPANGTPQELGSAITYARRYCLCSVTGVAPESDDDDGAAASHQPQQDEWENAERPPGIEQVVVFNDLTKAIDGAQSLEDIATVGDRVKAATSAKQITVTQYNALSRRGAARIAQLNGAPS